MEGEREKPTTEREAVRLATGTDHVTFDEVILKLDEVAHLE